MTHDAQQHMSRDVIVVAPELDLAGAWRMMERERIRHLVVLRASVLVGIVSDRDLLARGRLRHGKLEFDEKLVVMEAMSPVPWTCGPTARVSHIAREMVQRQIDAVPVVDAGGHVLGLVTSSDLLMLLIDQTDVDTLPFRFRIKYAS